MELWNALMVRLHVATTMPRRDEQGDVPGWVLITVMTAGLVAVLWEVAEGTLSQMLRDALNRVS
ncbi:MAG TPA: hypothetical protein VFG98_08665 [Intrasporangium sp.]|nr:hypothetical protein [Intrasporangium sp.]